MGRNIEIKARVPDDRWPAVRRRARRLAAASPETLRQVDTFFNVGHGRLKLRVVGSGSGELIAYDRPDGNEPKASSYAVSPTSSPETLLATLARALGVRGVVRKTRELFQVGQTRIHLDEVDGLGRFLELEVVLREGQSDDDGRTIARDVMRQMGVEDRDLVAGAYVDLLEGPRSGHK